MAKSKEFIDLILDKFGENVLIRDYPDGHPSIPTGSLALDVSTGIGGIPLARYTEIWGAESTAKTTLCLSTSKQALKLGYKVLYVDVENSLDLTYAKAIIGDEYPKKEFTNFLVLQPESAEDALGIAEMGIDHNYRLIIFDSIGSISPRTELDDPIEKQHIGLAPRLTNQFLRKTAYKIRDTETAFIFTNQVRANVGSYVGGYSAPAGYALKHYTSMMIFLSKNASGKIKEGDDEIGTEIKFVIQKNKLATPYRSATTTVMFGKGIDSIRDTIKFAALLGIVKGRGAYYVFEDTTLGLGYDRTVEYLKEHPELLDKIEEMCYNITGLKYPPIRKGEVKNEEIG